MIAADANEYHANILQTFGHNVQRVRKRRQYSFSHMEKLSGYGRQYISALELGKKDIQFSTAVRIARALDVPLAKLFTRSFDSNAGVFDEAFTEDDFLLVFSSNVRRHLMDLGKKEIHIYIETGMDTAAISRMLNVKTSDPRISTLVKIAFGAGADLDQLLSRS